MPRNDEVGWLNQTARRPEIALSIDKSKARKSGPSAKRADF
jgi:hypothetical protein